jgi:hypothetical protein
VVRISVPARTALVTGVFSAISASLARWSSSSGPRTQPEGRGAGVGPAAVGRLVGGQPMLAGLKVDVVAGGPDGRGGVGDPLGLPLRLGRGHHSRTRLPSA